MRVLIDATIVRPVPGGIAMYTRELAVELARRDDVEVTVVTSCPEQFAGFAGALVGVSARVRGFGGRMLWRERSLPRLLRQVGADVLLAPAPEIPLLHRLPVPALVVVHDLGAWRHPKLYGRAKWARFRLLLGPMLSRASSIACVSAATQSDLRAVLPGQGSRATVVREGVGQAGAPAPSPATPAYVLYVGPLARHKNVETLIRAFADPSLANVHLKLAGSLDDANAGAFRDALARLPEGGRMEHLGPVSAAELAELYAGAAVVALPSLHEGFGLPLLEAMVAGVPVVASSIPAHREVAAGSALLVGDPRDPADWARAIACCLEDQVQTRARTAAGLKRAEIYTWPAAAGDVHELLSALVGRLDDSNLPPREAELC